MMNKFNTFFCVLFLTISSSSIGQVPSFVSDSLDSFMQREMARWQIPGAAVAIVKDGKILVSKGYGVADIQTGKPVDASTLFMVASNSKAFTGTAIAMLEEEGKLNLDDPVRQYLPWLDLYDDCATEMVTIKDMLTHRIG
ncbi:MAG TPA: serine hydrolase, partial [Bacteroidetes bacterium]|nr:serine hydrolase [Bacteroidota bacterium]